MKLGTAIRRWTWELPQSLLGFILKGFYKKTLLRVIEYGDQKVYIYDEFPGGISLGYYTLIDYNRKDLENNITRMSFKRSVKHESGHGIQSKYLGPLYLPTVGILSASWNLVYRVLSKFSNISYYWFFVEKSADKLGKVER